MYKKIFKPVYFNFLFLKNNINILFRIYKKITNKEYKQDLISIVFIQTFPSGWNSVKPIFDKLILNEKFIVKVLVVPSNRDIYDKKKIDFIYNQYFKKIDNKYLIKSFDNQTNEWFNLKDLRPTYVFYNRPYDQELVNKNYRSNIVSSYSKICFLHYGYSLSNDYSNYWRNGSFIYNTSIIFAENLSKYIEYNNALRLQLFFNLTKIYNFGYPRFELLNKSTKTNYLNKNFTILWTPRWSFNDNSIDKSSFLMYNNMFYDFFKKNVNINFICRPHPLMFQSLLKSNILSKEELDKYILNISKSLNMSIDDDIDYINTIEKADLIITDYTAMIADFYHSGKQIIYLGRDNHFNNEAKEMSSSFHYASDMDSIIKLINNIRLNKHSSKPKKHTNIDNNTTNKIINVLSNEKV